MARACEAGGRCIHSGRCCRAPRTRACRRAADTTITCWATEPKILAICEPSLRQLPGARALPEPAELPADATGQRLVDAFLETLAALGRHRSTLVVIDDLQWADDLSLSLLANVPASFFETNRVMLLGTARSEELGPDLDRVITRPDVLHITLGRLDDASIGAMAADMMGHKQVPATLVSFLRNESQGNPFFAAEYMRAAVDAGMLLRDARGHWQHELHGSDLSKLALPQSIQEVVRRRLEALPEDAQRLLQLAALLGREFDPDVLGAIVGGVSPTTDVELVNQLADLTRRRDPRGGAVGIVPVHARPSARERRRVRLH